MKKIIALAVLIGCSALSDALAAADSAFACLQASAQSGGLSACLNEPVATAPRVVSAVGTPEPSAGSPSLIAAALDGGTMKHTRMVPTPTGFAEVEDGTVEAGFYKGLDSGFKTAFAGFIGLPVLGIQACGGPTASNFGTTAFYVLGILLAIPGAIVGVVAAPLGGVAGIIAEKVAPGSTKDWFTF